MVFHNYFTVQLLQNVKIYYGEDFSKTRRKFGMFLSGISLRKNLFERDYIHGAPIAAIAENVAENIVESVIETPASNIMSIETSNEIYNAKINPHKEYESNSDTMAETSASHNISHPLGSSYISPDKSKVHPALYEDFYARYMALLGKNNFVLSRLRRLQR
jgi:hypothetical protein